jgi:hypothetical protein
MQRATKQTARILSVLGVMASAFLVTQPAQADPPAPCYGSSCVGKSPYVANASGNCSSAVSLDSVTAPGTTGPDAPTVILRWNDWCHSNWAKFSSTTASEPPSRYYWWVETQDTAFESNTPGSAVTYTAMVDGTQLARACINAFGYPNNRTSYHACTAWH